MSSTAGSLATHFISRHHNNHHLRRPPTTHHVQHRRPAQRPLSDVSTRFKVFVLTTTAKSKSKNIARPAAAISAGSHVYIYINIYGIRFRSRVYPHVVHILYVDIDPLFFFFFLTQRVSVRYKTFFQSRFS